MKDLKQTSKTNKKNNNSQNALLDTAPTHLHGIFFSILQAYAALNFGVRPLSQ
uniref:Uncharacterized protein n=1 Tax=Anguilla anguilla TaxID=7936 RepID=A0A0E9QPZ5_ANGAN